MPRALWKGAISFGLVTVPVELYPASKPSSLDLTWLDKRSMSPVGYKRYNKNTGKEVPKDEIVKGYEYKEGEYVVLGPEDFKQANPVATQTVEILAFVERAEIAPLYFDHPYYLAPGKRGEKAYALLREAMKKADRAAIASVVIATKQHLAAVMPYGDVLLLNTLRYANEIRDAGDLKVPSESLKSAKVSQKEVDMALKLVESMADDWKPERYHDTYREDLLARVKEKVKAGETEEVAEPAKEKRARPSAEVVDLVALLQDSLRGKGGSKDRDTSRRAANAKTSTKRAGARKRAAADEEEGSTSRKSTRERKRA